MFGHMSPHVHTGLVAHTCLDTCLSSHGHDLRRLRVFAYIPECGRSHSHLCVYGFLSARSLAWVDTGLRRHTHPPPSPSPRPQALDSTPTLSPPRRGRVLQRRADAVSGPAAVRAVHRAVPDPRGACFALVLCLAPRFWPYPL